MNWRVLQWLLRHKSSAIRNIIELRQDHRLFINRLMRFSPISTFLDQFCKFFRKLFSRQQFEPLPLSLFLYCCFSLLRWFSLFSSHFLSSLSLSIVMENLSVGKWWKMLMAFEHVPRLSLANVKVFHDATPDPAKVSATKSESAAINANIVEKMLKQR